MGDTATRIDEPEVKRDARGKITELRVHFGPHHFFQLRLNGDRVKCAVGATITASKRMLLRCPASSSGW
jgi:hypothetical protein